MTEQTLKLFVSSPGDVIAERLRVDLVVERLNNAFQGRVRIETVRWETSYYSAHDTFQKQIPEAADCDLVIAIFRTRLGTRLPAGFRSQPSGEPYPSGTAYEVLSAMEWRKAGRTQPDIFVFRHPKAPAVALDAPDRAEIEAQWGQLKRFFDDWFVNEGGEFLAAFQDYLSTDDFAVKIEDCLRQWLARHGYLIQGSVWDRLLQGSPFPGLSAFEADRGSVFFGRDLAIGQAVERLRLAGTAGATRAPFLLIIGASGSGKSSLLRAGLLPRLTSPGAIPEIDLWRTAIVMPGPDPFMALAEALLANEALGPELSSGAFGDKALLAQQLAGGVELAVTPIRAALNKAAEKRRGAAHYEAARPTRLALAIDQAERLFTEAEANVAESFTALIAALTQGGLAYVIMTLRSDAYARFQAFDALVALREAGASLDLMPPNAAELEEIVTRPIAACQPPLAFENRDGRSLAALLVADTKGGDALPLLQMTLSRLYADEAERGDGLLRFADYHGMDRAVTETANAALDDLPDDARAELPALIAGLVADVSIDALTGEQAPDIIALDRKSFEAANPARKVLVDVFIDRRLLTLDGDGVSERLRPVHEALLRIWPEAVAIIAEAAGLIRVRRMLEPIVREWEHANGDEHAHHLDISAALLSGAQLLAARFGADLPQAMRDFIAACAKVADEKRGRDREDQEQRVRDAQALAAASSRMARRTGAGLAVALMLVILAGWQWRVARIERDHATRTVTLATKAANSLVFDLAMKFRNVVGVPAAMTNDILDRARHLQDQLLETGNSNPELLRSQAEALLETTDTLIALGRTDSALAAAKQAQDIVQTLLTRQPPNPGLEHDMAAAYEKIGNAQSQQGNFSEALRAYRIALPIADKIIQSDASNIERQRDTARLSDKIGDSLAWQGNWTDALKSYRASLAGREQLVKANPENADLQHDLAASYISAGDIFRVQGDTAAALELFRSSLAIAEKLTNSDSSNGEWQVDLAVADTEIGDMYTYLNNLPEAQRYYQESVAVMDGLTKSDSTNVGWQSYLQQFKGNLGDVLWSQGDLRAAEQLYKESLAISEKLAATANPDTQDWQASLALSYRNIGDVELARGDLPAAMQSYRSNLAILERLTKAQPENSEFQRYLSVSFEKIGDVEMAQGDFSGAEKSYQAELTIAEQMAKSDLGPLDWPDKKLMSSHRKMGSVLFAEGNFSEAMIYFQKSLIYAEELVKRRPTDIEQQHSLSILHEEMGDVFFEQGNLQDASKSYQNSFDIRNRLADTNSNHATWQHDLSISYAKLAKLNLKSGQPADARDALTSGHAILAKLVADHPEWVRWKHDLHWFDQQIAALDKKNLTPNGDEREPQSD